jgi:hypothetical protein
MRRLLLLALFPVNPSFSICQVVPVGLSTEIQAFNEKLESATKGMNNEETMALWAEENRPLTAGERCFSSWLNKPTETGGSNAKCELRNSQSGSLRVEYILSSFAEHITTTQPTGKITK